MQVRSSRRRTIKSRCRQLYPLPTGSLSFVGIMARFMCHPTGDLSASCESDIFPTAFSFFDVWKRKCRIGHPGNVYIRVR